MSDAGRLGSDRLWREGEQLVVDTAAEMDGWDRATWEAKKAWAEQHARELSDELLEKDITHYSKRYSSVMGEHSDFVKWEMQQKQSGAPVGADYTLDD